jgi:hypothetical protein
MIDDLQTAYSRSAENSPKQEQAHQQSVNVQSNENSHQNNIENSITNLGNHQLIPDNQHQPFSTSPGMFRYEYSLIYKFLLTKYILQFADPIFYPDFFFKCIYFDIKLDKTTVC